VDDVTARVERMRAGLTQAMRERDRPAVRALRQALAAVANAEAPAAPAAATHLPPEVGRLVEHERLALTGADVDRILRAEVADREAAIAEYTGLGRDDEATDLAAEVAALRPYLTA
jgi:uncharacterized protein YqeY